MDLSKIGDVTCGPRELSDAELAMVAGGKFDWVSVLGKAFICAFVAVGGAVGGPGGAIVGGALGELSWQAAKEGANYGNPTMQTYF
jgi:lactobin A/cerein 7B family class IIb bacteriocin